MSQEAWDRLVARGQDPRPQSVSLRRPLASEKSQRKLGRPRFNKDGSLSFPVKGDPPPCPDGYARVPGEPFKFISKWVACKDRTATLVMSREGTMNIEATCRSTEAPTNGLLVCAQVCADCPVRKQP
jgi:hypothetical protein